ncbi:LANO_0E04082g1_1 [Lachancea nothofagi CBS 11611]|uniref:LANO_0E04082g1_1 n=1 Tax=Lachancea nothofagi CBS 11611 TaxID=1266666 RepID=A0A1G4JRQ5_9SACH|nr:LANO_0E04082g1_1 [Lachancea nothofagi CBS 11611]
MSNARIVGHRAYRGHYPENTFVAFEKALEAGVDVIETDLQMSKDGIVVVNHDQTTLRCWNKDYTISETEWSDLKTLRCNDERFADLRMPTLIEILKWVVDNPNVKLMLDIKFTNNMEILLKTVADMLSVREDLPFWRDHIIWGLWALDWFQYGMETGVIKDFEVVCISLSLEMAKKFVEFSAKLNNPHFKLSGVSLHFVSTWSSSFQTKWIPYLQENNVEIFVWTINKDIDFKYCNALPISGFVTDFPVEARNAITKYDRSKLVFKRPFPLSKEGARFYSYLLLYRVIVEVLFSSWSQYKILGNLSFSLIMIKIMKTIHFL